jgi:hypothetical protein
LAGALRGDRREFWFATSLLITFGAIVLITHDLGAHPPLVIQVPQHGTLVVGFTWHNLVNACASAVASLFVRYDALAAVVLSRTGLLWSGGALVVAVLVGIAALTEPRRLPVMLLCLIGAPSALAVTLAGRPDWNILSEVPATGSCRGTTRCSRRR